MQVRMRVALGSVALAIVAAPIADATPKKRARLTLRSVGTAPATVKAGGTFTLTARVANARNRLAASGRLTLSLRPSTGAKVRLDGFNVKTLRGGKVRTLRMKVKVAGTVRGGSYSLVACVRRGSGEVLGSCRTVRKLTITTTPAAPAPSPAPVPAPLPAPDTRSTSAKLRDAITSGGMLAHLREFQNVADNSGGNRASGLQGFGGTTEYLVKTLRAAGYQPTVQTFGFAFFKQLEDSIFTRTGPTQRTYVENEDFATMSYSGTGDTTAQVTAVDINLTPPRASTSGCEASDFSGFQQGRVALMQRGSCDFGVKVANAEAAGATAAIIFNQGNTSGADRNDVFAGTLGRPVGIPAVSISFADGQELATGDTPTVRIKTKTLNDQRTTNNVLAETPGGNANEIVLVGSHLDSVPRAPGSTTTAPVRPSTSSSRCRWPSSASPPSTRFASPGGALRKRACWAPRTTSTSSRRRRSTASR